MAGPVQGSVRLGSMLLDALSLTDQVRPRVCLVYTATGDPGERYAISYEAFNAAGCDVTELRLFTQPSADPHDRLGRADLVWVGGGSVANLLALWRLHGVDSAMRSAWEQGVILGGVSAGSICWHLGGNTDSFGPDLAAVTNGLGLLPYGNSVHYDSEVGRRPSLHGFMSAGVLPPLAYATDDHVGIWYEGLEASAVVADANVEPRTGPAAYRVELIDGEVVETRVEVGGNFGSVQ